MNEETAREAFDSLVSGDVLFWDCKVLRKDGYFKAHCIQLARCVSIKKSLRNVACTFHEQPVYELNLCKYSSASVLELLRFLYLTETADLRNQCGDVLLAEELFSLAKEIGILELQDCCIKALNCDEIVIDECNYLRLAQLAGETKIGSHLLWRCWEMFKKKFETEAASAITETREHAPLFLAAVILEGQWNPRVDENSKELPKQDGIFIDATNNDIELFGEIKATGDVVSFADMQIRCSDMLSIHCHRNILSRVPHFKRMLLQNNKETNNGVIEVEVEKRVMMEVVQYIYTGTTDDLCCVMPESGELPETFIAEPVVDLAQQYGLCKLKQQCHDALLKCDITEYNVLRLIGVARLYELVALQQRCFRYFFDNRQAVLSTEQWLRSDLSVVQAILKHVNLDQGMTYLVYRHSLYILTANANRTRREECDLSNSCGGERLSCQLDNRTVMLSDGSNAKLLDLTDGSTADCSAMLHCHETGASCELNGSVYVTGGSYSDKCERYNRIADRWEKVADMNYVRSHHDLTAWKGSLLAIGGTPVCIERYDSVADRWDVIEKSQVDDGSDAWCCVVNGQLWVCVCTTHNDHDDDDDEWALWKVNGNIEDEWLEMPLPADMEYVMRLFERRGRLHIIAWMGKSTVEFAFDEGRNVWNQHFVIDHEEWCDFVKPIMTPPCWQGYGDGVQCHCAAIAGTTQNH